jgi:hypothetical protein
VEALPLAVERGLALLFGIAIGAILVAVGRILVPADAIAPGGRRDKGARP